MSDFSAAVPATWTREGLLAAGYVGFTTFEELRARGATTRPGIYVVLRSALEPPTFRAISPAGRQKDFTERIDRLDEMWIGGAETVYIGLATWGARRDGIHRRLKQYRRTGSGAADNHGGGVWVFQLSDADTLTVCWRAADDVSDDYVKALEHHLIANFAARPEHGRRPFANRKD